MHNVSDLSSHLDENLNKEREKKKREKQLRLCCHLETVHYLLWQIVKLVCQNVI